MIEGFTYSCRDVSVRVKALHNGPRASYSGRADQGALEEGHSCTATIVVRESAQVCTAVFGSIRSTSDAAVARFTMTLRRYAGARDS